MAATGGTVTTNVVGSTTNIIHTFKSSGTFTANIPIPNVTILVVGGGGSAGGRISGGGGGGAVAYVTNATVSANTYTVTVGAGGGAPTALDNVGNNGSPSSITLGATISAAGGGGGGAFSTINGTNGGCGGGAGAPTTSMLTGGNGYIPYGSHAAYTNGLSLGGFTGTIYGYPGGNLTDTRGTSQATLARGGGGAGAAATDGSGTNGNAGAGGDGVLLAVPEFGPTYSNKYWGGGGGGGAYYPNSGYRGGNGGKGGGGAGGSSNSGGTPTGGTGGIANGGDGGTGNTGAGGAGGANTGGGGGGSGDYYSAGSAGATGIVIVCYVNPTPAITVNPTSYPFPDTYLTKTGTWQYTVSGVLLSDNITITRPTEGFTISTDNVDFTSSSLVLTTNAVGTVASTTIYVHFVPTVEKLYDAYITNSSAGLRAVHAVDGDGVRGRHYLRQRRGCVHEQAGHRERGGAIYRRPAAGRHSACGQWPSH